MKYLNLIASDFDSLTEDCVDQYTEKMTVLFIGQQKEQGSMLTVFILA